MHKKVIFVLEQDEDGYPPVGFEGIWGRQEGNNRYVLDNIPFFTREATLGDVVEAVEEDGELKYRRQLVPSGNSLIRVVCNDGTNPAEVRKGLEQLGCVTEWSNDHNLIAINVPPEVNLRQVQEFLRVGYSQDRWDYEEAILRQ